MAYSVTSLIVTSAILSGLVVVAVCLRIWVRVKVLPTYIGADDWLAIVSCIIAVGYSANLIVGATVGFAGQDWPGEIPEQRYIAGEKYMYVQVVVEKVLYATFKLSALYFFRRIFTTRRFKLFTDVTIGVVIVWAVVFLCLLAFQCGAHPEELWTPGSQRLDCLNQTLLNLAYSVTDAVLDTLIIIMPFPAIKKLQLRTREKVGIAGIFLLGALAAVASWLRLAFISQAVPKDFSGSGNKHGAATPVDFWCMVEANIGTFAICLPPLAPLLRWSTFKAKRSAATTTAMLSQKKSGLATRPSLSQLEKGETSNEDDVLSDTSTRIEETAARRPSESWLIEDVVGK